MCCSSGIVWQATGNKMTFGERKLYNESTVGNMGILDYLQRGFYQFLRTLQWWNQQPMVLMSMLAVIVEVEEEEVGYWARRNHYLPKTLVKETLIAMKWIVDGQWHFVGHSVEDDEEGGNLEANWFEWNLMGIAGGKAAADC